MKQIKLASAVFLITLIQQVIASFKIESPTFPDLIHFRSADFGYIPYGKILQGKLIMSNQTDPYGCFNSTNLAAKQQFLLVKYGNCSVIQKALVAQQSKVKMLIVMADHDSIDEVHMLNTVKSDKVTIPVILFSKNVSDEIINEVKVKNSVLNGRCFFPRNIAKQGPVSIDYWFDPFDSNNYPFFYRFSQLHKDLDKDVKFRIHLALTFDQQESSYKYKMESCVSDGKYCGNDPDGPGRLQGKDEVLIGLALLCLQEIDSSYKLTQTLYQFDFYCLIEEKNRQIPLSCLTDVAKKNGYNITNFNEQCFAKHFKNKDLQGDNDLLENEKLLFQQETVQIWPELYVNQRAIRGDIQTLEEVESAICGGFQDPIPSACYDYFEYQDDSINPGYIILTILLSALVMFLILFGVFKLYYHKKFKEQIDGEVNNVIQRYLTFQDETDNS
ncbi:hypothetical protein ABPG72_011047 [Tetrahymena utriculariae]